MRPIFCGRGSASERGFGGAGFFLDHRRGIDQYFGIAFFDGRGVVHEDFGVMAQQPPAPLLSPRSSALTISTCSRATTVMSPEVRVARTRAPTVEPKAVQVCSNTWLVAMNVGQSARENEVVQPVQKQGA